MYRLLGQARTVQYVPEFLDELRKEYTLAPIWLGDYMTSYSWNEATFGFRLMKNGHEIGNFAAEVTGRKLHITSFGRKQRRNLDVRNGVMTSICVQFIGELVKRGLTDVSLMDHSNGYWEHFSSKHFPKLKWEGVLTRRSELAIL
jgi:hypothetical protein